MVSSAALLPTTARDTGMLMSIDSCLGGITTKGESLKVPF